MMIVIPTGSLINLGLKAWIFTKADLNYYRISAPIDCSNYTTNINQDSGQVKKLSNKDCAKIKEEDKKSAQQRYEAQRQRDLAKNISFLIVGLPLFGYHWYLARKKEK